MSTEQQEPVSLDAVKREAIKQVSMRLRQAPYLVMPDAARRIALEHAADCIVPMSDGSVRALRPGTRSEFLPVHDTADPLAELVSVLVGYATDEERLEAVALREKNVADLVEEKLRSGGFSRF